MKTASRLFIALLLMAWLSACTNTNNIREVIWQGLYYSLNQEQKMRNSEEALSGGEEPPGYEQYKKERQKAITGQNGSPSQ